MAPATRLSETFVCPICAASLTEGHGTLTCSDRGSHQFPVRDGIPRFVELNTHESFAIQWKRYSDVQVDSQNGTTISRDRLLDQSGLRAEDFRGRSVLEVGCGAGRFTDVMLGFGANVVALDYTGAIDGCAELNALAVQDGRLVPGQADVFALPVRTLSYDIVVGYGMLQHTGDAEGALRQLWRYVRVGGLLLVDRYQLDLRHILPFKYALRPLSRRLDPRRLLRAVEVVCRVLVPVERLVLARVQGGGWRRYVRYLVARFPNATYPLNLEARRVIGPDLAWRWSVLETYDQYAPRFDSPCTADSWRKQLTSLDGGEVVSVSSAGQGNIGVVRRLRYAGESVPANSSGALPTL